MEMKAAENIYYRDHNYEVNTLLLWLNCNN